MTEHCNIRKYGDRLLFNLKGKAFKDFEKGMEEAFDCLSQYREKEPDACLQTFVDTGHRDELDFFLRNGFYINNTMLFMERKLRDFSAGSTDNLLTGSDIEDPVLFEEYDINKGLTEYLAANAQGFGEQDPEEMIREELSNPGARIYVARVKGRIAASVTVWEIEPRIFATENIFTVPEYRGRHLAREILKKVLMTISVNGAKTARLSVFGDDFEALGLYYGLGFELKAEKYELRF